MSLILEKTLLLWNDSKGLKICQKDRIFEAIICCLLFQNLESLKMSKILLFLHFKAEKRPKTEKSVVFLHFGNKKVEKSQNLMKKNFLSENVTFFSKS